MIKLGVEAISWHAQVAGGEITLAGIIDEASLAGAEFLQVGVDYVAAAEGGVPEVVRHAADSGLFLRSTGRPIGRRYWDGDRTRVTAQVREWLATAAAVGSDSLMLYSGVYRPELAGNPAAIAAELDHLSAVLNDAQSTARDLGIKLLLENASDFTTLELLTLLDRTASESVGLFLDLTNIYNVWDDPLDAISRLGPYAHAGHIKDFVLESVWADSGYHRHGYTVRFKYPGEGVTPVDILVRALADQVAERDFCLAIEGLDSHAGVRDQVDRLRPSFAFLRHVLEATSIDQAGQGRKLRKRHAMTNLEKEC